MLTDIEEESGQDREAEAKNRLEEYNDTDKHKMKTCHWAGSILRQKWGFIGQAKVYHKYMVSS